MVSMRSLLAYFWADEPRVIYFVVCCVIVLLLAWRGKDRFSAKAFRYLVLPSAVLLVILLNPIVAHILVTAHEETRSLRFFWLVPVTLILAVSSVRLVSSFRNRKQKILLAMAVPIVLLMFSDNFNMLRRTWQNRMTNGYDIPSVVIALGDWIMEDDSGLDKRAVFPQPLNLWVRQYRPEIALPFEWHRFDWKFLPAKRLYNAIELAGGAIDLNEVEYWAIEGEYNYIVLDSDEQYKGKFHAYQEVYRIDVDPLKDTNAYDREYTLYRLTKVG